MKYIMKQHLLAAGNDFSVKTENGADAYIFDGKVMSLRGKIVVKNPHGEEVATILRKLITFLPTYSILKNGQELATVRKKLFTFRKSFLIDVPGPDDITVIGKLVEHDYRFYRGDALIAHVSKQWFTGRDTYGIDVSLER